MHGKINVYINSIDANREANLFTSSRDNII